MKFYTIILLITIPLCGMDITNKPTAKTQLTVNTFKKNLPTMTFVEAFQEFNKLPKASRDLILNGKEIERLSLKACKMLAYDFVKKLPETPTDYAYIQFTQLPPTSQKLIWDGTITSSPFVMLFCVPQDIFIHIFQMNLPSFEQKPMVTFLNSQFTYYDNKGYAKGTNYFLVHPAAHADQVPPVNTNAETSTDATIKKLLQLPVHQTLSAVPRYARRISLQVEDFPEHNTNDKLCLGCNGGIEETVTKTYPLSLEDIVHISPEQETLLRLIIATHNKGIDYPQRRHQVTQSDKQLLMPIKDLINKNILFARLQISTDYKPIAPWEKIADTTLFATPLFLVSVIIPQLLHDNVQGRIQGLSGAIAAYASSFLTGRYIFPTCDRWNSSARRTATWFGPENRTEVNKQWSFGALGLMHYLLISVAHRCTSSAHVTLTARIIGYSLQVLRSIAFTCGMFDLHPYLSNSCAWVFSDMFDLKKYNDPVERRNKDDKSYTLSDLLNYPE